MASLENKYGKSAVDATRRNALPPYLDTLFEGGIVNKTDIATTSALGLVKPDGNTVTIDADGTIHSQSSGFGGIEMHGVDLAANAWSNKTQTVTISTYAIATSDFLSVPQIETSSEYSASGVVLSSATVNVSAHTASLVFSCTTVPTATVSTTVLVSTSAMETGIALADAIANYPKIQNGKWYVWNVSTKQWVDTGVKAGITSIIQTTTSTADGGTNVVTATLSDGTKTTFNIKNGQKGSTGAKGDTGAAAGFANPTATATTLSPGSAAAASVTASGGNTMKQFDFSFGIPQGEKGDKGDKGDTGAAAGFGTPTASATTIAAGSSATASVTASGSNTSKVFAFTFGIPKGEKGEKGAKGDTGATGATGAAAGFGTPTATANTLAAGSNATVSVTASGSNTSKVFAFTFGIPKGEKGAKGDTGATGPTGPTGPAGSSIQSIARTSGTGEAGSTDTYTITLTNGNTATFQVKNGNDGKGLAMRKATLTANGWSNNSQTVQISASASAASDFLSIPEADTNDIYAGAGVKMTSVSINEGTVDCTFTCTTTPTADVNTVILVSTSNESIEEYLNGIVDDMTDLYNQTEADFNTASGLYVKKAGDTMTGPLTLKGEQYNGNYGLNANNSDIVRVNRVAFSDRADSANEGIDFYRDSTHWDTIWAQDGTLLFTPNRSNNATTSAADSQKIARFPSTETADRVVFSNDANGGLKTPYTNTDATNLLLNSLGTGTSAPTDNDYYISQYVGGGTTTTTYHRRPVSALWEYIKSKISSVLGLTASNYSGTAAFASSVNPANITDGYTSTGFYLNTHPEAGKLLIPFINNDIAYLTKRGGSAKVYYDGVEQSVNIANVFDGSPSYWAINPTGTTEIIIELTLHVTKGWTNTIYVDFGAPSWRAKSIKIEVMNSNYANDVWTVKSNQTNYSLGEHKVTFGHTPVGASNAGGGFNKIRFTFSDFATSTIFRIACLGLYNYGSSGLRETFLPKDGGEMYGGITPYLNNSYNIGSSSKTYNTVYATSFSGTATRATADASGNNIKTTYLNGGSVSQPTFTGTQATIEVEGTPTGTVSRPTFSGNELTSTGTYTPAGSVSQPTFTGDEMTSTGSYTPAGSVTVTPTVTLNTTTVNSITAVGSLSSLGFTPNATSKNMTISWNAGTLPTKGANTTVATSVKSATATGSFGGTAATISVKGTPDGTVSKPTFSGTRASLSLKGTPSGSVSQPTFTGDEMTATGTYTPAGTVSRPTFTGTHPS